MSNYYPPLVFITVFLVFFTGAITTGNPENIGQGDTLQKYNITQEDLRVSPDLPQPNPQEIDLDGDLVESNNINVTDSSYFNNTDFRTDELMKLENESSSGWALYRLDGDTKFIVTQVTKYGFFEDSNIELEGYVTANTNETPTEQIFLANEQTLKIENDDTNFIRVVFDPSDDKVYSLTQQDETQEGLLGSIAAYISSAGNAVSSWLTLLTGLPSELIWISIIFIVIGGFIVLEVILW